LKSPKGEGESTCLYQGGGKGGSRKIKISANGADKIIANDEKAILGHGRFPKRPKKKLGKGGRGEKEPEGYTTGGY